jgi:sugar lactone lactonase YvrE
LLPGRSRGGHHLAAVALFVICSSCAALASANKPAPLLAVGGATQPGRIYASDGDGGDVYVFPLAANREGPLRRFGPFNSPTSLATDASGNVYVPDMGQGSYDGRVYIVAPGKAKPFLTLDDTGALPSDIAVDSSGVVYVANGYDEQSCGGGGDVRVYAKGATVAGSTICDQVLGEPFSQVNGIAVDSRGDVFVTWQSASNRYGRVREFVKAQQYAGTFIGPRFGHPYGIAIDKKGDIVVSNVDLSAPSVTVLNPTGRRVLFQFAKKGDPLFVAFSATEQHIYVGDALANQINEYAYGTDTILNTIAFPGQQLDGLAIFPKDQR